jgi:DNA repair exonuclease SbcCD ATPase subunit
MEKDYTQKIILKRKKLREILDKNNKMRNQLELIAGGTQKIAAINRTYSNSINAYIQEINGLESRLASIKQEEERKKMNQYAKMKQKIKEFRSCCEVLNSSVEELIAIVKKNKINGNIGL